MPLGCPSLQQKSDSLTRSGIGDCTDAAAKDSPGSSHRGDESPLDAQTANICHRRLAVGADSTLASPRSPTEAGPLSFGRTQSEDLSLEAYSSSRCCESAPNFQPHKLMQPARHSRGMSAGCLGREPRPHGGRGISVAGSFSWKGAAAKLKLNEPEILASRVPKATSLDLCLGEAALRGSARLP